MLTYDANGNILTLNRNGLNPIGMDSLTYSYTSGTNQLKRVDDLVSSTHYDTDIDDQSGTNYTYDAIGNLVRDVSEQIDTITWTLSGKVDSISRSSSSAKQRLKFMYDPFSNRIESHIYGSTRLGMYRFDKAHFQTQEIDTGYADTAKFAFEVGLKRYEITNHLGNEYKSIFISGDIYSSFLSSQLGKYTSGKVKDSGTYYNLPADVITDKSNWNKESNFFFKTGEKQPYGLKATETAGRSIFWKKEK